MLYSKTIWSFQPNSDLHRLVWLPQTPLPILPKNNIKNIWSHTNSQQALQKKQYLPLSKFFAVFSCFCEFPKKHIIFSQTLFPSTFTIHRLGFSITHLKMQMVNHSRLPNCFSVYDHRFLKLPTLKIISFSRRIKCNLVLTLITLSQRISMLLIYLLLVFNVILTVFVSHPLCNFLRHNHIVHFRSLKYRKTALSQMQKFN